MMAGWWPGCCCGKPAYFAGGSTSGLAAASSVVSDKLSFSTFSGSAITAANLTIARMAPASIADPQIAGYFCGGYSGATVARTDKLTFSSESTASATTANLTGNRSYSAGISERDTKGYALGGSTDGGSTGRVVTADKLTFASDSMAAATTANLSATRFTHFGGMSEGTSKGYVGGGLTAFPNYVKTADKITFSSDTTSAQTTANLTVARQDYSPLSDGSTHGFWNGGQTGAGVSIDEKLTFSTDTTVATTAGSQQWGAASASNGSKGLVAGGVYTGVTANVKAIDFSTDTYLTMTTGALSQPRMRLGGVSQEAL